MTKAQELDALAAFRESLPTDSYLRPWLDSAFAEIQDCIMSDIPVRASYKEAAARSAEIVEAGTREAERVKENARNIADSTVKTARQEAERIASRLREAIRIASKAIEAL